MASCANMDSLELRGRKNTLSQKKPSIMMKSTLLFFLLASALSNVSAQECISLSGSTQCPAFNASSISTGPELVTLFPFLTFVSNTKQFDDRLSQYISSNYVQQKYQLLLGCDNVNLKNTTNLYARYTTSVICNSIIQNSVTGCKLSTDEAQPLCAESCAQQATSEEQITVDDQLCGKPSDNYLDQIRADFTNCALPNNSLSSKCIGGEENEPVDCGFSTNLQGLCGHCALSSPNATDSCCVTSNVSTRCTGVVLPSIFSVPPLFLSPTSSGTSSASNTAIAGGGNSKTGQHGLTGGQIAGIVIGSIVGAALLISLLLLCCICLRRRREGSQASVFNQRTPQRKGPGMIFRPHSGIQSPQPTYTAPPAGRVARMSALEGTSSDLRSRGTPVTAAVPRADRREFGDTSESEAFGDTPESRPAPITGKRNGSLSSGSALGALDDPSSPISGSGGQTSSPEGVASGQSEQLPFFKDYYSQDEIHPNDKVATLWAYQPRAADEFELERGDMLKVVGIWDDGWATGVRINDHAENYDGKHKIQRDSGVSNGSGGKGGSPPLSGEIKAFPLVCVCLPEHWKKTIEGDGFEGGSSGPPSGFGP